MKIFYRDFVTGKTKWTNPKRYEITQINLMGQLHRGIIAHRKSDYLVIPEWALVGESRLLLADNTEKPGSDQPG